MPDQGAPVLLLDIMGTVVYDPFFVEVPRFLRMDLDELLKVKHPTTWVRFELDQIDEEALYRRFYRDGRELDGPGFKRTMEEGFRFLDGMESLLEDLKALGVQMHALSNYPRWYALIEDRLRLSRFLTWDFVSCHTGVRKPDPNAYLGPARVLGRAPGDCIFVDDRLDNVRGAQAVGMPGIMFEDAASLRSKLEQTGIVADRRAHSPRRRQS